MSTFLGPNVQDTDPYIPQSLEAYIQPRVLEGMDTEQLIWGDCNASLAKIGFDIFLGGQCHSFNGQDKDLH